MGRTLSACVFSLLVFLPLKALSNEGGAGDSSKIIRKIEYCYTNKTNISQEVVEAHVKLKVGEEFSPFLADSSIRSLYSSGKFEHVAVKADEASSQGGYNVVFHLTARNKITSVKFTGNTKYKPRVLNKKISSKTGSNFSDSTVKADIEALKEFYNNKGFPHAEVSYEIENGDNDATTCVTFHIAEGEKVRIGKIRFIGNDDVKSSNLLKAMRTKRWHILSFLTKSGLYKPDVLEEDLRNVKNICKNHGYLDASIDENAIIYSKRKNAIDICIPIVLGERYYVSSVSLSGNKLYTNEELEDLLLLQPQDVFSPAKLDASCESIVNFYGKSGYINTNVSAIRQIDLNSNQVGLEFFIRESEKSFINTIEVKGNSKTRTKVILRELSFAPGDVCDAVRLKNSRARLLNTGHFSFVDISPADTDVPEKKNIVVEVKENNTGKFGFGGGVSTGGEVVGFLEFTQRNFDLHSDNKKFQGGGQKFRSRLQVGKRSTAVDINFEEPWWYDRELTAGVDLFFHKRNYKKAKDYSGANYNETRYGSSVYLRKRLFELWEGKLSYTLQNVKIFNISPMAPRCFFDEEGNTSISKMGFALERDARDSFINPTSGSRVLLETELAGGPFFGETKYLKLSASAIKHWLVHDTAEQVLSVIGRAGSMMAYRGDTTPFFERFYLGGQNFMKGFKAHDVGPRENGTGIGGNSFAYIAAEYCIKLTDIFRVYGFAEAGFVNAKKWDFSTKNYAADCGVGLKILIMGMPLRLDFGFPIHGDKEIKRGMQFNYSFGVSF